LRGCISICQIKEWLRQKKIDLIKTFNPEMKFLINELYDKWPPPVLFHRKSYDFQRNELIGAEIDPSLPAGRQAAVRVTSNSGWLSCSTKAEPYSLVCHASKGISICAPYSVLFTIDHILPCLLFSRNRPHEAKQCGNPNFSHRRQMHPITALAKKRKR
jgi:hypothetical protein